MKLKVGLGVLLWLVLISVAHVQLNVGWGQLGQEVQQLTGHAQEELQVGFLPVT